MLEKENENHRKIISTKRDKGLEELKKLYINSLDPPPQVNATPIYSHCLDYV